LINNKIELHINLETKIDVATGLSSSNTPVFLLNFTQKNLYVVIWNAKWFKHGHYCFVKAAFGIKAAANKLTSV